MSIPNSVKEFETEKPPTWCPGCGNFGIWTALKQALSAGGLKPHRVAIIFGIGCSGNQSNCVRVYGFHGLHGRALPVAEGVALANRGLTVVAVGGDGDGYGEGLAHFVHTMRANPNITYIVHDNQVYGLTKGQASPTSARGTISPSTPYGSVDEPVNPIALALAAGCGFVARGFSGDAAHLAQLIQAAITYRGFALVNVLQPCVTFKGADMYKWFFDRVVKLETLKHNPADRAAAWNRASLDQAKLPIGIFYRQDRPTLEDGYPMLKNRPLVSQSIAKRSLRKILAGLK